MRSRWQVGAAVIGGVVAAPAVAYFCLFATVIFTYDTLAPTLPIAFAIFTVLTVPLGLLVT